METMAKRIRYSTEVRKRAVRLLKGGGVQSKDNGAGVCTGGVQIVYARFRSLQASL